MKRQNDTYFTFYSIGATIPNGQQPLRKQDLKFLDKEIFGVVDTDKCAYHITILAGSEI